MTQQPEAIHLANMLEAGNCGWPSRAAAELRRQHAEIERLTKLYTTPPAAQLKPLTRENWIETNDVVCALLRQAHDALSLSSVPPKRQWVGLTDAELAGFSDMQLGSYDLCLEVEAKLKEKNT